MQENQDENRMPDSQSLPGTGRGRNALLDLSSNASPLDDKKNNAVQESRPYEKDSRDVDIEQKDHARNIIRNNKPDIVAGRYTIQLNEMISEYSSSFVQAYAVKDKKEKNNESLYCLVFNNGVPIRLQVINTLKSIVNPRFIVPLASEITYISSLKEFRFVVVLSKPQGVTLASYIESTGPKLEDFLTSTFIPQLVSVLELLDGLHIMHGRINPENIFIDPATRTLTLGECVSDPAGYSQSVLYETIDRAMAIPLGKGEGDTTTDYYAVGIVALFMQLGKPPVDDMDEEGVLQSKLINGTFNALLKNIELSPTLMDFYRGLLNDKPLLRWGCTQLRDWLKGKYFNLVRIPPPVEATRSLMFNDVQYFSLQALAYALYKHWKVAKLFLREDKLTKWIEGSVGNPELADKLRHIQKITSNSRATLGVFDMDDELVARTIHLLNPQGPFQFKNISVNLNAFGTILAYEFSKKRIDMIQPLGQAFAHNLFGYLESYAERDGQHSNSKLLWHIKNVIEFIQKTSLGFGMERCLYELNTMLPCQSPLVVSDIPLTVKDLMEVLDMKCEKGEEYPMDRHIAAFIANRVGLTMEIRIKGLAGYPKFSNNPHIQAAALLTMAQRESGIKKLKGISMTMAKHLLSVTDILHGKTYKKELVDSINRVAKEGSMQMLYKVVSDSQFILLDQQGFEEARRHYLSLEIQLSKLKGKNTIANLGYHYGLRLSVVTAYVLCGLEFFYFIFQG